MDKALLIVCDSTGTTIEKRDITIDQASGFLGPIFQRVWGNKREGDTKSMWNESIVCQKCYTNDLDAPSIPLTVVQEGGSDSTLIPLHILVSQLTNEQLQIICKDPKSHQADFDYYWSPERTASYLADKHNRDLLIVAKQQEDSMNILGWYHAFSTHSSKLHTTHGRTLTDVIGNKEVYYIDTIGYDLYRDRAEKALVASKISPYVQRAVLQNSLQGHKTIFRTHKEATHVTRLVQKYFDMQWLADSGDNASREYYSITPNPKKILKVLTKDIGRKVNGLDVSEKFNNISKLICDPEKSAENFVDTLILNAIRSEDPVGVHRGQKSQEYITVNEDEIKARLMDSGFDVKFCAAIMMAGWIYSFGGVQLTALLTNNPIIDALAIAETASITFPIIGGLPGVLRAVYLSSRSIIYAKKYNESFIPKLLMSLASSVDLGILISPFISLKDDDNTLRRLISWSVQDFFRQKTKEIVPMFRNKKKALHNRKVDIK